MRLTCARVSLTGLPLFVVSSWKSSGRRASKASAILFTSRARERTSIPPHSLLSKARAALFTARSMSAAVPCAVRAITSPVAGLWTSIISSTEAGTSLPSMNKPWLGTDRFCVLIWPSPCDLVQPPGNPSSDHRRPLQRPGDAPLGRFDVPSQKGSSPSPVAHLQGVDHPRVLQHQHVRFSALRIVHAHPDEPVHLLDELARGSRHSLVAREPGEAAVELPVVAEEPALVIPLAEGAKPVERGEILVGSSAGSVRDRGGLQDRSEAEEVARIADRDGSHPVTLPGSDGDEPLPLQAQERVAHRRLAHREARRKALLAQLGAGRKLAGENLLAQLPVDVYAQQRSGLAHLGTAGAG